MRDNWKAIYITSNLDSGGNTQFSGIEKLIQLRKTNIS